jgi:transcriptional regulator with XRE-family HTH domain
MGADRLTWEELGRLVRSRRGAMGVRAAAGEIGISHSTLSRIENGHVADLETLRRLGTWLSMDLGRMLGASSSGPTEEPRGTVQVVFRKDRAVRPETSQALGNLILRAYEQFARTGSDGHV